MASHAAPPHMTVFTPRPTKDQIALHRQLLDSLSSADSKDPDSNEALPPTSPRKARQRSHVQFARSHSPLKGVANEGIRVDEVDGAARAAPELNFARSARSRSRSLLRSAAGPRSASRPARRRALSRGRPISRDTTFDQPDDPAMTPEEIARELRPESFTRFKRISDTESLNKTPSGKIRPTSSAESREFDFEKEAKAIREMLEQMCSPASLSPDEEMNQNAVSTTDVQEVKLPETEAFDQTILPDHQEEELKC